jgi:penicillin amidase
MELLRRAAQGRLAEILGPVAIGFDHALRLVNPTKAVSAISRQLPDGTRDWLAGFVAGINHHSSSGAEPPLEFRVLGISAAPWSIENVLEVGRLLAADVNWIVWRRLLQLPRGADWPQIWQRIRAAGTTDEATADLPHGSNAVAVAGRRSATGHAWLAGDPHLPLILPNIWLAAAYLSPSYNVAGLMMPGIPVMAIGRNPWIAWGGTNLHAASSELFDVSGAHASAVRERQARLKVRWAPDRELLLRETEHGPIISDLTLLGGERPTALRWIGHEPSDEISALLAINRARDWGSFRCAAAGFAVPGQTLVYADRGGHVGRLSAVQLPCRPPPGSADLLSPPAAGAAWNARITAEELPAEFDPASGFVASANEQPPRAAVAIGWFFSPPDRALRLARLLEARRVTVSRDLLQLLEDVYSARAVALRDWMLAALPAEAGASGLRLALAGWDGRYDVESAGALAYELVLNRLVAAAVPAGRRVLYEGLWAGRLLLAQELEALGPPARAEHLRQAVRASEAAFRRWRCWGAVHRLKLAHPLALMPGLRRRYRFTDWPWPGSTDTVMKSTHSLVGGQHAAGYGSNARYVFDLSNPDANDLVVLGGQDGVPGSAAFLDQAELFRRGGAMRVPLRPETARRVFPYHARLQPASRP